MTTRGCRTSSSASRRTWSRRCTRRRCTPAGSTRTRLRRGGAGVRRPGPRPGPGRAFLDDFRPFQRRVATFGAAQLARPDAAEAHLARGAGHVPGDGAAGTSASSTRTTAGRWTMTAVGQCWTTYAGVRTRLVPTARGSPVVARCRRRRAGEAVHDMACAVHPEGTSGLVRGRRVSADHRGRC